MMMSASRSAPLQASPAHQTAMKELGKLLQDTGRSLEGILSSYVASISETSEPELMDVTTSLSMGIMPSICNGRQGIQKNASDSDSIADCNFGSIQFLSPSSGNNAQCLDAQNWLYRHQSCVIGPGKASSSTDALKCGDKGGFANENALKGLLEEIKKTICDWSYRFKAIQQVTPFRGAIQDGVAAAPCICLPDGVLSASLERGQETVMSMHSLVGKMPGHRKEGEENSHYKQNEKGNREDNWAQNHSFLAENGENTGCSCPDMETEKSPHLGDGIGKLECHLQSPEQPISSSTALTSQELVGRETAACLSAGRGEAQLDSSSPNEKVPSAAEKTDKSPPLKSDKSNEPSLLTSLNDAQAEATLQITKWTPPSRASKTSNQSLSFPRTVEIITSPQWLPDGWVTELKTRGSGNSAGSKDKYYVDPVSHRRFRSRKEVISYLESKRTMVNDGSPETRQAKKFREPALLSSLPNKLNKKAKLEESTTLSSSASPSLTVPSSASPGLLSNMLKPPFRTGQPSEWRIYESLASFPFLNFDPFYYKDFSANKSGSFKDSHAPTKPWFFTGPEAFWNPFMDRSLSSKPGDKGKDSGSFFPMPFCSGLGSKAFSGGTKKPSKQKFTGL